MNDSHGIVMYGLFCSHKEADVENGPTALPCSAELWVVECDGFGMQRIMSGLRSTRNTRDDGSMSMHVRRRGTIPGYMLKVS